MAHRERAPEPEEADSRIERASRLALAAAIGASLVLAAIAFLAAAKHFEIDPAAPEPEEAGAMATASLFDEP